MKSKIAPIILATVIVVLFSVCSLALAPPDTDGTEAASFTDVSETAWYYSYVTALTNAGVINGMGDGTFEPDGTLTWAQAMKLLLCAHGDLEDVTGSRWAETAMGRASGLGLCDSSQKGTSEISRLQFCQAAAKLFSVDGTADTFSDCADTSVLALAGAGIINGYPDGNFGPDKTITRAEISKVVYLLMQMKSTLSDNAPQTGAFAEQSQDSTGSKDNASYDTTAQYSSTILSNGDAIIGGTYIADGEDESVLEASGNVNATVTGAALQKISGNASSADDSSFRGVNSAVRVYGSAVVTLESCDILAAAQNATGVFAYEAGTIYMDNCTVNVTGGGAGGVQVAGGGTLIGKNLNVKSASKAAIRSDRGGGTLQLDGGTYTSTGSNGCPAIYSTANITVCNASCSSENSRAVIIEGKNSVTLENCTLIGNDQSTKEGSVKANVMLYQSASGDASIGTSLFRMTHGSMTCLSGAMFYCTNTSGKICLTDTELLLSEDGTLLIVSAGRWGKDGRNGGNCEFSAVDQTLNGTICVDEISSLEFNLSSSNYEGNIQGEGSVLVSMDADSTWTLNGDSHISSLSGDFRGLNLNGYTLYINGTPYAG